MAQDKESGSVLGGLIAIFLLVMVAGTAFSWVGINPLAIGDGMEDAGEYKPVEALESIETENSSVIVRLRENPGIPMAFGKPDKPVTHLQLASDDGDIATRVKVYEGQQVYRFTSQGDIDGNYTIKLIHRVPPDLFGENEDETETAVFSIENGSVGPLRIPQNRS